ncbi:MAG: hypothetical protein NPIRA06_10990 [Nitrospirales bacterium]|nr:MAG: hypothetical protein NPIRA06_10990 [Nitrospirales bacterium]
MIFGENRDKGGRHGSFRKKFSQQIGNSISDVKGVCGSVGAKQIGENDIPDKPENPTAEGGYADQPGRTTNPTGLSSRT